MARSMAAPLGAHVSIAGGVSRALPRGSELDCDVLQIFVKNASQWRAKPLARDEIERFRTAHQESEIGSIVAHASYLINLATTDPDKLEKSRSAVIDELQRCDQLGVSGLVVHPGAHLGAGLDAGLEKIATSLRSIFDAYPDLRARVLLENTAGQGTLVGFELDHLARIIDKTDCEDRIGVCIDTCHAFAAGYAIHLSSGYERLVSEIDSLFDPREPSCFHLNDSRYPLESHRDRHANIGRGEIGIEAFARLLHDPRFAEVPMILETPIGDDGEGHRRDLETLRSL